MVGEEVRDPRELRSDLSRALADFLMRACAPYREQRYAAASDMKAELERIRTVM